MRAALWAGAVGAFSGCAEHEPEIERRGPPLPPEDPPIDCEGGEGGAPSVPVRYCQAEIVLREVCQRCHQNPPLNGAPFPLVTYADTQVVPMDGIPRWQRMEAAVSSGFMPLRGLDLDPPVEELTCEQRSTLLGWLRQCAPPEGGTDCGARDAELLTCETAP